MQVGKIVQEVEELGSIEKELNRSGVRGQKRKEYYRRNPPDKISDRVARKRRRETMQVPKHDILLINDSFINLFIFYFYNFYYISCVLSLYVFIVLNNACKYLIGGLNFELILF